MKIFKEMFSKRYENLKKANCICKFIRCLLFILALPFMLYFGILLFWDSILTEDNYSFLFYSKWKKNIKEKCIKLEFCLYFIFHFLLAHIFFVIFFVFMFFGLSAIISLLLTQLFLKIGFNFSDAFL